MSFFDSMKQQALSHIPGADNATIQAAVGVIEQQGGIGPLAQRFRERGLGGVMDSWISTGQNQPIAPNQVQDVLGSGQIEQLAGRFGIPKEAVASQLAHVLPQVVDKLTPDGKLPQAAA